MLSCTQCFSSKRSRSLLVFCPALLPAILVSLLNLTTERWELVIVFDGCKDGSIDQAVQVNGFSGMHDNMRGGDQLQQACMLMCALRCLPQPDPLFQVLQRFHCLTSHADHQGSTPGAATNDASTGISSDAPPGQNLCASRGLVHVRLVKQPLRVWQTSADNLVRWLGWGGGGILVYSKQEVKETFSMPAFLTQTQAGL